MTLNQVILTALNRIWEKYPGAKVSRSVLIASTLHTLMPHGEVKGLAFETKRKREAALTLLIEAVLDQELADKRLVKIIGKGGGIMSPDSVPATLRNDALPSKSKQYTCTHCKNDNLTTDEKSCWKCGTAIA